MCDLFDCSWDARGYTGIQCDISLHTKTKMNLFNEEKNRVRTCLSALCNQAVLPLSSNLEKLKKKIVLQVMITEVFNTVKTFDL